MTTTRSVIALIAIFCVIACNNSEVDQHVSVNDEQEVEASHSESGKYQNILDAIKEETDRTKDLELGYVPRERLITALKQTRQMQKQMEQRRSADDLLPKFDSRGPIDIGGRTRAIHIDLSDPDRNKIWVGSVSGGLFVTEDITASPSQWKIIDDYLDNLAVIDIVQDPNDHDVMYIGTGESSGGGVRGIGVFKSEDGGESWRLLDNTSNTEFRFCQSMLVDPRTSYVYAATSNGGIQRSENGGESWIKVVGIGVGGSDNFMYDLYYSQGKIFASSRTDIYMSETGDRGSWVEITRPGSGFPSNWIRNEFTVCPNDADLIYAVGTVSTGAPNSAVYKTTNGGDSWSDVGTPQGGGGQAWYDLDITIDPFNCNRVIVGEIPLWITTTGGGVWTLLPHSSYQSGGGHVDQHKVVFDDQQQGLVYFGNDGGIWRSIDGQARVISDENYGYISTQYYGCAIHPDSFSNYMLGGTQDNGSHQLNDATLASGRNVWGGDGFLCHIDQNDPIYQMVSSQFGRWGLSTNGGNSFSGGTNTNSRFLTPSDYDNDAGILYTQTNNGNFYRWNVKTGLTDIVNWDGVVGGTVSTVAVDPNTPNRVYFGTFQGRVYRVDSAHVGLTVQAEQVYAGSGTISSVALANGNPDELIISKSNYGLSNNVLVSRDGGDSWDNCEGNLPDMPVRWAIFSPLDSREALIATETGVWATSLLNGTSTQWNPPVPGKGTPLVRTDQLDWRKSDNVVIAATYGRGLWTSTAFSQSRAKFIAPQVHYQNSPLQFIGSVSVNAQSYEWSFGDGTTSTEANPIHVFEEIGTYDIQLTINGELSTSSTLKILPKVPLPYANGEEYYGGGFEGQEEQIGIEFFNGSSFGLGNTNFIGKNGTKSGDFAMVLDPAQQYYEPNTNTSIYFPEFDFSEESIYTFSFWGNYFLDQRDGFVVQYSTDAGQSWNVLGKQELGWYNANGGQLENSAWPNTIPYFTKEVAAYTLYTQNVSFLSGEPSVAFRIQFRSEDTGQHPGMAIDDVEITKYEGELQTALVPNSFTGEFTNGNNNREIELKWNTRPEYYCQTIEVMRSTNGRDFETIETIPCLGRLTDRITSYKTTDTQSGSLYFYKLRVSSSDQESGYEYEFYSPTITVSRSNVQPGKIFEDGGGAKVFPNPFTDAIYVTFTSNLQENVIFELYDATGRLVVEREAFVDDVFGMLDLPDMPSGTYYLSIQIGTSERKVYGVVKG